ncbi:MAG: hypothetical protein ABSD74_13570 [Rhizomicrobium sp.]
MRTYSLRILRAVGLLAIAAGADVNAMSNQGATPLILAAQTAS